jgi:hypothetical protein
MSHILPAFAIRSAAFLTIRRSRRKSLARSAFGAFINLPEKINKRDAEGENKNAEWAIRHSAFFLICG